MSRQREQILVVDDSEMNREILKDILSEDYDIVEAEDGVQAIEIMQEHRRELSVVLLDMVMPRMDGLEVLERMNENHWLADLPVIIISAETDANVVHSSYEQGASDYIVRPFDAVIVRHRTANTIKLYARQRKIEELMSEQFTKNAAQNDIMEQNFKKVIRARDQGRVLVDRIEDEDLRAHFAEVDAILTDIITH